MHLVADMSDLGGRLARGAGTGRLLGHWRSAPGVGFRRGEGCELDHLLEGIERLGIRVVEQGDGANAAGPFGRLSAFDVAIAANAAALQ
jgi:hypothetical protein